MRRILFITLLLLPFFLFSQKESKLEKAKESLSKKSSGSSSAGNIRASTKQSSTYKTYESTFFSNLLLELTFYATVGVAFGAIEERDFNPYPYFYDNEGEYATEPSDTGRKQRFSLGGNLFFSQVKGISLNALYKPVPLIGIDASFIHFTERNFKIRSNLNITSLLVNYYRFREKRFSFWWGLGASYVGSKVNKLGFAYSLGMDIYPIKPISLSAIWKQSLINNSEVDELKLQFGYHIKNKAVLLGYHNYQLGSERVFGFMLGLKYIF